MIRRKLLSRNSFSSALVQPSPANKPSDDAVTTSIKAKLYSEPLLKSAA